MYALFSCYYFLYWVILRVRKEFPVMTARKWDLTETFGKFLKVKVNPFQPLQPQFYGNEGREGSSSYDVLSAVYRDMLYYNIIPKGDIE